jgi:hypothetical protein
MMAFRVRVRGSFHCVIYRSKRETFIPRIAHAHTEVDMNIDESDTENIVLQQDSDSSGKPGVQSTRSSSKRRTLDSVFTLDHEFRGEEEDEGTGYT